jgi:hypothetical protein
MVTASQGTVTIVVSHIGQPRVDGAASLARARDQIACISSSPIFS